ncbi:MAG: Lrp/AsnC family transcriptional regulator [Desulfurococcales archaeon]|nr:Lrp/AsnC family transcriptional regulator [Desulfurococcales archaeon]
MNLDQKDLKILEILCRNARTTYSEIAKAIGVSDVAVIKRIKKLEQAGVIKKYTVILDPRKLGYKSVSITGINTEPEYLFSVLSYLKEKDYVKYIALTSGDHSIMTIIWARDGDEMARIHEEISKLPGVTKVCPSMVLEVLKEDVIC